MTHLTITRARSARLFATAALAMAALHGAPVAAQPATVTLLQNQATQPCGVGDGTLDTAARFRTGSLPWQVEAIQITWHAPGATPGFNRVGIFQHDAASDRPSTQQVGGWKETNAATQAGAMTYNSPQAIELLANTDYWVVADITDGSQPHCTTSAEFTAASDAGAPTLSRVAALGTAGSPSWPVVHTALTMVYALDGMVGTPPPRVPDMAIGLVTLRATGTVGIPYTGTFECANIGQRTTDEGTLCTASGLPPELDVDACTVGPANTPWQHQDDVPAGESVLCTVSGTPTAAGTYSVLLQTGTEVDAEMGNNEARRTITIAAAGPTPGPGPDPGSGAIQSVPTLSEWALLLLSGTLLAAGIGWSRRQRTPLTPSSLPESNICLDF